MKDISTEGLSKCPEDRNGLATPVKLQNCYLEDDITSAVEIAESCTWVIFKYLLNFPFNAAFGEGRSRFADSLSRQLPRQLQRRTADRKSDRVYQHHRRRVVCICSTPQCLGRARLLQPWRFVHRFSRCAMRRVQQRARQPTG